jgi:aspartyl-tRNA(Asn)/glutamyl-tRNA(Gln) amidotransferase subunit C
MSIRAEDVYRLAKLAKLRIAQDAVEGVERDLSKILQMVDQLREVDTSGVEPMVHAIELSDVLADDVVGHSLSQEEVLQNAPAHDEVSFRVPPVLG